MRTIAAISTSPGVGGIGIIRISGNNAFEVVNKIFKPKKDSEIEGYTMKYGYILNPKTQKILDEVLVSYFVAPKSYTTENMCEINSHGSIVVMRQILELCLENGAELAEPGEFTKKAFLNGRIDLSQAEAITDLINSKSEKEAKEFLEERGLKTDEYIPNRLEEGYGLNNEAIDSICEKETKLLITVDCGISGAEEVEYARSKGLDVIVTDHHECPEVLPDCIAVIDAKRPDSTYPFNSLAGCGVAFKVVQALCQKLNKPNEDYLKYLDIACLGTVADIVPLVEFV